MTVLGFGPASTSSVARASPSCAACALVWSRIPLLLQAASGTGFRWALYYEAEGWGNPSVAQITADLTYIASNLASNPSYLRIDGKFVVFVYGDADAEYASFQVALRTVFTRLSPAERSRFEIEVWPGDVHGFLNVPLQRRALERALAWLERMHSHPPARPAGDTHDPHLSNDSTP